MQAIISKDKLQNILIYFLAFVLFVAIMPKAAFGGDMNFWLDWTGWIHKYGLGEVYNHRVEYHPFFLYCLYIFQWIMGTMEEVKEHLNYVKVFPLIFDFIGALSILLILKNKKNAILYPFFILFNIAYMYNTMLWGQVDSIHTAFIVLSLVFVLQERPLLSVFFFMLALNAKLQAIIFLPIIGLLLLPHFTRSYQMLLKTLGVLLLTQVFILLPFIIEGSVGGFWRVITEAEGRHPQVSMNAFNFWYYFFDEEVNLAKIKDVTIFAGGVSYKNWGKGLFLFFSAIALIPLLKNCFYWIKDKLVPDERFLEMAFLTAGVITIIFFYFNTQMHERYTHSAIILFFFYGVKSGRYLLYLACSFAYLMNMEKVLKVWEFSNYITTLIFDEIFISSVFLSIIALSIIRLYRTYFNLKA